MSLPVEGRNEIIAMPRRSVGKVLRSRKIQQNAVEVDQFSQRFHDDEYLMRVTDPGQREAAMMVVKPACVNCN
jgi:hypothetical protein